MGENGLKGVVEGVIDDAVDKVVGVPIRKGRQNKKRPMRMSQKSKEAVSSSGVTMPSASLGELPVISTADLVGGGTSNEDEGRLADLRSLLDDLD